MNRGIIWSQPKILAIELICILNILTISPNWNLLKISKDCKRVSLLWGLFLIVGIIATIKSSLPLRSLLGGSTMKSGLLYWGLIAIFMLSNALVLKLRPEIGRSQLQGLVMGGLILALSTFPQMLNWQIDYTLGSGNLVANNILQSGVFQGHQPIGLYSHRGYAAFTLAAAGILAFVGWRWKWITSKFFLVSITVILPALLFTQTRAALLALVISVGYLLGRKHYKLIILGAVISTLFIYINTTSRYLEHQGKSLSIIKQVTSDRITLWEIAVTRIKMQPLLGWGFDGFEIAYPHLPNGKIKTSPIPSTKAHNLVLDTAVSVGIIGTVVYLELIAVCLYLVCKSSFSGIEAIAIAYLVFTFTWFECAQFTHIFWWSLSFFNYEKNCHSTSTISQLSITSYRPMFTGFRSWISRAKATVFRKV
ncbi:O-antigen polymerase [Nostoc sp. RF31YmG]|nr:O-antigen polymerase [Nostoc sp. RF31YmG]